MPSEPAQYSHPSELKTSFYVMYASNISRKIKLASKSTSIKSKFYISFPNIFGNPPRSILLLFIFNRTISITIKIVKHVGMIMSKGSIT